MNTSFLVLFFIFLIGGCSSSYRVPFYSKAYYEACSAIEQATHSAAPESLYRRALHLLTEDIEQTPSFSAYGLRATLFSYLRQFSLVRRDICSALCYEPPLGGVHALASSYACLLAEEGKRRQAFCLWHRLLYAPYYLTPEVVWYNISCFYYRQQEYVCALGSLEQAIKCNPHCWAVRFYAFLLSYKLGYLRRCVNHGHVLCRLLTSYKESVA